MTGAAIVFSPNIALTRLDGRRRVQKSAARPAVRHYHLACRLHDSVVSVALVLTGIANWKTLNNAAPVCEPLKALGSIRFASG